MCAKALVVWVLCAALTAAGSAAASTAGAGASILVFPRVVVDGEQDTAIQLVNLAHRLTLARCRYVDSGGDAVAAFDLRLVGRQPTRWLVSTGRAVSGEDPTCSFTVTDCPDAGLDPGTIPAMAADFAGALVCVQVDQAAAPLSGNALAGVATLTTLADGDIANYAALGLIGLPANDADEVLCIDGEAQPACSAPEYSACPREASVLQFSHGAPDALAEALRVETAFTGVPCSALVGPASAPLLQATFHNEIEQSFSTSFALDPATPRPLHDGMDFEVLGTDAVLSRLRVASNGSGGFLAITESARVGEGRSGRTAAAVAAAGGDALLTFPYVLVNAADGRDTVIHLANDSDAPVPVVCAWADHTPQCVAGAAGESCLPGAPPCSGFCQPTEGAATPFRLTLTAAQPLQWRAGAGLQRAANGALPAVDVPAAGAPFVGTLRCAAVGGNGAPLARNALRGVATLEYELPGPAPAVDAAQYAAVGNAALGDTNDGDAYLVLGGPAPEYESCGARLALPIAFDLGTLHAGARRDVTRTTIALTTCGADLSGPPDDVVAQFLVYNEYGQRFSTSRAVPGQLVRQLARIDSQDEQRSLFSATVSGTLAGQVLVRGADRGLAGVAIEQHGDWSASRPLIRLGDDPQRQDVVAVPATACAGDCGGNGVVSVDDLVRAIDILLTGARPDACPAADLNGDGTIDVAEVLRAVRIALDGCPRHGTPPPTPVPPTPVPTVAPSEPGPALTYLGVLSADDVPLTAAGSDGEGRPIFARPHGEGFSLVIEAKPGTNGQSPGTTAVVGSGESLPDLQVIVSRPLGDGSVALCDTALPQLGGVPAADPFGYDSAQAVTAVNDLGCRVEDGRGEPLGGGNACTRPATLNNGFVAGDSTRQFCLPIAAAWAFPAGDTIVRARVRATNGTVGPEAEIVIRVGGPE